MSHAIMLLFGWTLGAFLNMWLESMTDMFVFCYLTNSGLKMIFSILGDVPLLENWTTLLKVCYVNNYHPKLHFRMYLQSLMFDQEPRLNTAVQTSIGWEALGSCSMCQKSKERKTVLLLSVQTQSILNGKSHMVT